MASRKAAQAASRCAPLRPRLLAAQRAVVPRLRRPSVPAGIPEYFAPAVAGDRRHHLPTHDHGPRQAALRRLLARPRSVANARVPGATVRRRIGSRCGLKRSPAAISDNSCRRSPADGAAFGELAGAGHARDIPTPRGARRLAAHLYESARANVLVCDCAEGQLRARSIRRRLPYAADSQTGPRATGCGRRGAAQEVRPEARNAGRSRAPRPGAHRPRDNRSSPSRSCRRRSRLALRCSARCSAARRCRQPTSTALRAPHDRQAASDAKAATSIARTTISKPCNSSGGSAKAVRGRHRGDSSARWMPPRRRCAQCR